MQSSKSLKRSFLLALLSLLIAFLAAGTATFAWYIYNASAHTTKVRMAAGTTTMLEISKEPDKGYSSSVPLSSFSGRLNPVSTNDIRRGFRKVYGFVNTSDTRLVARLFRSARDTDFYSTSLFLRAKGAPLDVYISDLKFKDSNAQMPISSAIRLGVAVHAPGKIVNTPNEVDLDALQYIIEINPDKHIKTPEYNTYTGTDGHVLDLTSPDADATVLFKPLTPKCFCGYDNSTAVVTVNPESVKICELPFAGTEPYGEFVQVDLYIWLEGCDPDCTNDLASKSDALNTLKDVSISFAGVRKD